MADESKLGFIEHLVNELIEYRADQIEDPKFKEYLTRSIEAGKRLDATLTDEQRKLRLEEDGQSNSMYTLYAENCYKQGLKDGVRIYRMLTGGIEW